MTEAIPDGLTFLKDLPKLPMLGTCPVLQHVLAEVIRSAPARIGVHHRHDQVSLIQSSRRVRRDECSFPGSRCTAVDVMIRMRTHDPILTIPTEMVITSVITIIGVPILVLLIATEKV